MKSETHKLIDDLEQALERMRGLDPALLASLVAKLDRLRGLTK